MSDTASGAIEQMEALKQQFEDRLMASSEDFRALRALEQALESIRPKSKSGPLTLTLNRKRLVFAGAKPTLADKAEATLKSVGRPLPVSHLVQLFAEQGSPVGGDDPNMNLSSTLSRYQDRFVSIRYDGSRCWWLRGQPLPPDFLTPPDEEVI